MLNIIYKNMIIRNYNFIPIKIIDIFHYKNDEQIVIETLFFIEPGMDVFRHIY